MEGMEGKRDAQLLTLVMAVDCPYFGAGTAFVVVVGFGREHTDRDSWRSGGLACLGSARQQVALQALLGVKGEAVTPSEKGKGRH